MHQTTGAADGVIPIIVTGNGPSENHWARLRDGVQLKQTVVSPKLRKAAIKALQDLFFAFSSQDPQAMKQIINQLDQVVGQLADSVRANHAERVSVNELHSSDDAYLYHHSLSVAVMSISIGQELGFSSDDVLLLGKCAMIHDIGHGMIPAELLNKPSRLTDDEVGLIRQHPVHGYNYLKEHQIGTELQRQGVAFHHERVDGTGYAFGLKGPKIPQWSKIIAIADVFDAMTSKRPYREAISPGDAIEYIMGNVNYIFDYDLVQVFIRKIELYPIGSFVQLSTGNLAVVLDTKNKSRPLVRVI